MRDGARSFRRIAVRAIGAGIVGIGFAVLSGGQPVAAAGGTLRIEPAAVSVAKDQTFVVQVVQEAPVATSGAQASVDFDPSILQVVSVERGSGYTSAPVFEPPDLAADIAKANRTGHLAQVAAALTPPGAVPPGPAGFLIVRFRVVGCGTSDLGLPTSGPFNAQMISGQTPGYGAEVAVTTTGGRVTTCVAPDAVTASVIDHTPFGLYGIALPGGLLGAIAALGAFAVLGILGAVARRSRRPRQAT